MSFLFEDLGDGYIRMRCKDCGKKLKTRTIAKGQIFRCPRCQSVIMMPVQSDLMKPDAPAPPPAPPAQHGPGAPVGDTRVAPKQRWAPSIRVEARVKEIDRVFDAIRREYERLCTRCQGFVTAMDTTPEKKTELMRDAKAEAERNIRSQAHIIMSDFQKRLTELRNHPMSKQALIQSQIQQIEVEMARFELFVKGVIDSSPSAPSAPPA